MSATMSTDCEKKSDPAMMDVQEEVKLNSPIAEERHTPGVDATDRDPNHLNDHVKVSQHAHIHSPMHSCTLTHVYTHAFMHTHSRTHSHIHAHSHTITFMNGKPI